MAKESRTTIYLVPFQSVKLLFRPTYVCFFSKTCSQRRSKTFILHDCKNLNTFKQIFLITLLPTTVLKIEIFLLQQSLPILIPTIFFHGHFTEFRTSNSDNEMLGFFEHFNVFLIMFSRFDKTTKRIVQRVLRARCEKKTSIFKIDSYNCK